jgi:hypothetical protein
MKIKTKVLTTFLNKFRMDGMQKIEECVLKFGKEGLTTSANSNSNQSRSTAILLPQAFVEYESIGGIGINELGILIQVFGRFGDTIQMSKQGNLLTISGDSKKVDVELVSEDFIRDDTKTPELSFANTFDITSDVLNDMFKDIELNKNYSLQIMCKSGMTTFSNSGKYKFTKTIETPTCIKDCAVKFGRPFVDAVTKLTGTLKLSIADDYPCFVIDNDDLSVVSIIVAPLVREDE